MSVLVTALHRLSSLSLCAPLVFGAAIGEGEGESATPPTSPAPPPDETPSDARWYRPTAAESRPPPDVLYVPLGVLVEPQLGIASLRGGTLTSVLATFPLGPVAGLLIGAQISDTARFTMGLDLFRYTGLELAMTKSPSAARLSAIFAPTVGVQSFIGGGVVGGDGWIAPAGLRAVIEPAHMMAELRLSAHLLLGGQLDSTNQASVMGTAGSLGLQLVIAPLFAKSRTASSDRAEGPRTTASSAGGSR